MTRRYFLKLIGISSFIWSIPRLNLAKNKVVEKPNILFIMADDHATNAISCYGSRLTKVFKTPNIDRIAKEGMKLTSCFCTNSICTPSRASILTGQYSHKNGVYTLYDGLDPKRDNLAKQLQMAGYQTAVIGKWHLHNEPSGFDYYKVLHRQGEYFNPEFKVIGVDEEQADFAKRKRVKYKGYTTDVITDLTIEWLNNRDKNKPFFLMCNHKAPHAPWQYAPRHEHMFDNVEIPEPESLWEDQSHRSEGSRGYGFFIEKFAERAAAKNYPTGTLNTEGMTPKERRKAAYQKYLKDYLRTCAAVDESVGRLLNYLDKEGLTENTIVVYTSDQGLFLGEHNYIDKRWMYEESLRMPFLIRYPREIKPGSVSDEICLNIDFAPTFLDYAGVPIPKYMQGRSFRPILQGKIPKNWRTSMYYRYWLQCSRPAHFGIRTKEYKLIFFYGQGLGKSPKISRDTTQNTKVGWELYDLRKDPKELKNEYNNPVYSEVIKELKKELRRLREELGDTDENYPIMQEILKKYWD